MKTRKKVTFLTLIISHYRVVVHEQIRKLLAEQEIDYQVVYSDPLGSDAQKSDTRVLEWAIKVPLKTIHVAGQKLQLQSAAKAIHDSDLVIISQENKLLMNYYLIARYLLLGKKVAYFGHGRGYQAKKTNGMLEHWKRFLLKRVYWWFAYTPGVANLVSSLGFPDERITTVCNSIDTTKLREDIDAVSRGDIARFKRRLGVTGKNIGIYIGGMYEEKRLAFLCEAAIRIRKELPDFELLLVGSGSHAHIAKKYAAIHEFIHVTGPIFGRERATALKMADAFLMPGLLGLAILDSFIGECPVITTDYRYHSPEIEYLKPGENGILVQDDGQETTYADAVIGFFKNPKLRNKLKANCRLSGQMYTAENMAHNMAEGMRLAVGS